MTRTELATILADLVLRNAITLAEIRQVLARFDAGDLSDDMLPMSANAEPAQSDDWLAALAFIVLMARGKRARDILRTQFESKVMNIGLSVATGTIPVHTWQRHMQTTIANYARRMAVAGAGKVPSAKTQAVIEENISGQWSYLTRFTTQIASGRIADRPMSQAAVIARSALYGGAGWASFYRGNEDDGGFGWISNYISRDDRSTCSPCLAAERNGPYLLGQGPMPGSVCLGGGACRCERVTVYDPVAYAELIR